MSSAPKSNLHHRAATTSSIALPQWLLMLSLLVCPIPLRTADAQATPATTYAPYRFAVATIRKSQSNGWRMSFTVDGFSARGVTLQTLVQEAYNAYAGNSVTGGPAWTAIDRFDLEAKLDPDDIAGFRQLSLPERRAMLQALLADRFKLTVHREHHTIRGYAQERMKDPPKLLGPDPQSQPTGGVLGYNCSLSGRGPGMGEILAKNCTLQDLGDILSDVLPPKVVNQTGLSGPYNFTLRWTPDTEPRTPKGLEGDSPDPGHAFPSLLTAIREQLGLKLVPAQVPAEAIILDHADQPTGN